ncbi:MAG: relaxase domain-containing protein [Actinomycetota bacterium]|nr:relaxase domain-containing protein [Actinomycetota bacterium]MDQ6946908.1 relaxase domain-containing protein [Actinomycetota bacterium]
MIAKIKVLGLRAANGGTLRTAARGIVSYLQGSSEAVKVGSKQSQEPGLAGVSGQESRSLAGVVRYYVTSGSGHSQGRARGTGAAAMGLVRAVSGPELEAVLLGCHAQTGERLVGASGSSGRSDGVPVGARPVAGHGDPGELLTLAEAAFLAGVRPGYLRRLAEQQPQTSFPTPVSGDQIDPRLVRRLFEVMAGVPITAPATALLLAHKDPASGEWRVRRGEVDRFIADRVAPETVMGFDMVCSAPKSVSLLWAVGGDAIRSDIAEAMDTALDATVAYLEQHGCFAMVDGHNHPADGLGITSFVHDTSRADDAHLHVHNLIANAVRVSLRDADGRPQVDENGAPKVVWRAPDGDALMRHVKAAGYLGAAELRHQLAVRWGVTWAQVRSGVAELAAFPEPLLRAFSTRHDQVAEEFAHMVDSGFAPDGKTEAAAQRASRAPKNVLADAAVRAVQEAKLAEIGWTPGAVRALAAGQHRHLELDDADVQDLYDLLVGPSGLTERQTTFTSRDVHQAVASWAGDRLPADRIRVLAEAFLADRRVVLCGTTESVRARQNAEPMFTTEGLLAVEDNLLTLFRHARVDQGATPHATVPDTAVTAAITSMSAALAVERDDPNTGQSQEQAELVRAITACGDGIRFVIGPAGTGKTEAMRAAVEAWRRVGCRVLGSANGGAQTEQLGVRLGVESQVVRSWLTRLETADDPRQVWPENTAVLVDEATQVATRDAEKLCRWAARTGTVLVFVGDPAQLSSVGAGGWFAHIVGVNGAPSLSQIYRQQGDDMAEVRAALAGLRSQLPGRVRAAMERLSGDGRVRVFDDPQQMLGQVVDDWYRDRQSRLGAPGRRAKPSHMMAAHRREVELLNLGARRRLAADGTIRGPELPVTGRRFAVGDEVVTLTQSGHSLIPDGATRDRYIRTGTIGTVTAVHIDGEHPERQWVSVRFAGRGTVKVPWSYLNHSFDDGRVGGLAHAYAVTADRAEGSTMHAARAVATDSTSRPALYVMVSRGQRDVCAYLTRDRNLESQVDEERWLPVLSTPAGSFDAVVSHLERSRAERLASDIDPSAWGAQRLRQGRSLAEIAEISRAALADPQGGLGGVPLLVARRAELAEESAVMAAAIASPRPEVVARIGGRPGHGEPRRAWDAAVGAVGAYQARWSIGPDKSGYGQGAHWAIGPRPAGHFSPWQQQRGEAEALVRRWAAGLDPTHQQRFSALIEHIPRQRATAGIHALLAAGVDPTALYRALSERECDTEGRRGGARLPGHRPAATPPGRRRRLPAGRTPHRRRRMGPSPSAPRRRRNPGVEPARRC